MTDIEKIRSMIREGGPGNTTEAVYVGEALNNPAIGSVKVYPIFESTEYLWAHWSGEVDWNDPWSTIMTGGIAPTLKEATRLAVDHLVDLMVQS